MERHYVTVALSIVELNATLVCRECKRERPNEEQVRELASASAASRTSPAVAQRGSSAAPRDADTE